jgi:hypothetical protein
MAKRQKVTTGLWSKDEIKKLRKIFPNMSTREAAEKVGRPLETTRKKAYKLGLHKSKQYLKSIGRT